MDANLIFAIVGTVFLTGLLTYMIYRTNGTFKENHK
jgi:hypothetical protein